jgi:hypothetical protein
MPPNYVGCLGIESGFTDLCTGSHPTLAGGGRCSEIGAVLRSPRSKGAAFRFLLLVIE